MRFSYSINSNIPKAAWCALITKGDETIKVELGSAVPHNECFFVAGVWDGDFAKADFDSSNFSCCTGIKLIDCVSGDCNKWGGVKFSTPSHLLETIYAIRHNDVLYISNSLPFVLSRSGSTLEKKYMEYQRDLCSSMFGVVKQVHSSPLADGRKLDYYRCCNVSIDSQLNISIEERKSNFKFDNFSEYESIMNNTLSRIRYNASDRLRDNQYDMISTISQGYDAVATSVLARKIGCKKVLTFCTPEHYSKDCGTEIAKILGYEDIIEADADLYLENEELIEASCIASGDVGSSIVFAAHKNKFKNSLVFLGVRGDSLWERNHANVNNNQDFSNGNTLQQTDHSFVEACLDVNAVCIPVPMIASDKWVELTALSKSKEMEAWSVREKYDRPLARRIAESEGVPRESFGKAKTGAGISYHFDSFSRIMNKMSPNSAKSLIDFNRRFSHRSFPFIKQYIKFLYKEAPIYINYINSRLHIPIRIKKKETYISSPLSTMLINWSIEEMKRKYN